MKVQLKEVRTARGISQNELARRLEMSLANVQKIEYGKAKSIPLDTLDNLCKVLRCLPGDLLQFVPDEDDDQEGIPAQEGLNKSERHNKFNDAPPLTKLGSTRSDFTVISEMLESA